MSLASAEPRPERTLLLQQVGADRRYRASTGAMLVALAAATLFWLLAYNPIGVAELRLTREAGRGGVSSQK